MSVFSSSNLSDKGITVVLGSQWGDEGKGKLVDILAQEANICARCAVGIPLVESSSAKRLEISI